MSPIRMQRVESAVRVVIAFNTAFNQQDLTAMMQLVSDDCVFESNNPAPDGGLYTGTQTIREYWQGFFARYPRGRIKVEELIGYGLRCIMRWRYEWEDQAGDARHVRGVDIIRVQNDLIREALSYIKA